MNLKKKKCFFWYFIGSVIGISVLVIYGVCIEPYRIEIHHVWIQDSYFKKVLEKKIVVQLSDLHINGIGKIEQKILKILDDLQPDIILLTGDYVKWNGDYEAALTFFSQLKASIGIWAVMGDYDYSNSRKSCLFCHEPESVRFTTRHSVRVLRNTSEMVNLQKGAVTIWGVDVKGGRHFYEKNFFPLKSKDPAIILSHSPLSFDLLDTDQDVLMIAGDTHGGQIPLPSWMLRLMGYENIHYIQGMFEKGHKKMFVSRGIGTSHLPIRLFRKPEIVVLHFMPWKNVKK